MQDSNLVREGRASSGYTGVICQRRGEERGGERILGEERCVLGWEHEEHKALKKIGVGGGTGLAGKVSGGCAMWACRALIRSSALS